MLRPLAGAFQELSAPNVPRWRPPGLFSSACALPSFSRTGFLAVNYTGQLEHTKTEHPNHEQ